MNKQISKIITGINVATAIVIYMVTGIVDSCKINLKDFVNQKNANNEN